MDISRHKIHIRDEPISLRDTEKMLADEIAYSFDLSVDDAKRYLQNHLSKEDSE